MATSAVLCLVFGVLIGLIVGVVCMLTCLKMRSRPGKTQQYSPNVQPNEDRRFSQPGRFSATLPPPTEPQVAPAAIYDDILPPIPPRGEVDELDMKPNTAYGYIGT